MAQESNKSRRIQQSDKMWIDQFRNRTPRFRGMKQNKSNKDCLTRIKKLFYFPRNQRHIRDLLDKKIRGLLDKNLPFI